MSTVTWLTFVARVSSLNLGRGDEGAAPSESSEASWQAAPESEAESGIDPVVGGDAEYSAPSRVEKRGSRRRIRTRR